MNRRNFLAGSSTAALIGPSLALPAVVGKTTTLTYVPQANLSSLDPVWTMS
jgi:peptide/nickel transport system substrate-binding protein